MWTRTGHQTLPCAISMTQRIPKDRLLLFRTGGKKKLKQKSKLPLVLSQTENTCLFAKQRSFSPLKRPEGCAHNISQASFLKALQTMVLVCDLSCRCLIVPNIGSEGFFFPSRNLGALQKVLNQNTISKYLHKPEELQHRSIDWSGSHAPKVVFQMQPKLHSR